MAGPSLIIQPFANGGDLVTIPQTDPNGFVNYQQGYTPFYEISLASGNPQAKPVERQVQNALFNILTGNVQAWQQQGFAPWFAAMPNGYALNAMVVRQNSSGNWIPYRSLTNLNVTDPIGNPASWEYIQGSGEMIKNVPMPAGGPNGPTAMQVTAAQDFNSFLYSGTFQFTTDAVVSGSPNAPSSILGTAVAGMLEVTSIGVIPTSTIIQRYLDRRGTIFTRSAVYGSAWTAWNVIPNMTQVSAGRYAGFVSYNTNQVLTAAFGGFHIVGFGPNLTFTLPPLSTSPAGIPITFTHVGTGTLTFLPSGSDKINNGVNAVATSLVITPGATIQFDNANGGAWVISGGTGGMQYVATPSFQAGATFAGRPTFAGNTPWDTGNLNPANYLPLTGGSLTGPLNVSGGVTVTTGQLILQGWTSNANMGVIYFGAPANNKYIYFDGASFNLSAPGGVLNVNGSTVWNAGNLPNPMQTTGGTFTGQVDHTATRLRLLNGSFLDFFSTGNSYSASMRADVGGFVGFLNGANTAWNLQISDAGIASFRARPTWAGFTPWDTGNFNPASYQPAGSYARLAQYNAGDGFGLTSGAPPAIASITSQTCALTLQNQGNNAASCVINFRREGSFAAYFGLDTDNQWKVGGGSYGAISYVVWHQGNFNPASYAVAGAAVQWNSGIVEVGPLGNGTIGDTAPYVIVGGRACGNSSTANCIWLHMVTLRNQ